jgi:phage tail-like protein
MSEFRVPLCNPPPVNDFQVMLFTTGPWYQTGLSILAELAKPFLVGSFSDVTGLEGGMEFEADYREGGKNGVVKKLVKGVKCPPLVLKRGVTWNPDIWDWYYQVLNSGSNPIRKHGVIIQNDRSGIVQAEGGDVTDPIAVAFSGIPLVTRIPIAVWYFTNGLPSRLVGPHLNALGAEVSIEQLEIVHEGLYRLGFGQISGLGGMAGDVGSAIVGSGL